MKDKIEIDRKWGVQMKKLRYRAGCLLLTLMMIFCLPMQAFAARSGDDDAPRIRVNISIFENITHTYIAGPLTLQCPEKSSPEEVLQLLCDYAYLDEAATADGQPVSVTAGGHVYAAKDDESGWSLTVNGQQTDAADKVVLKDGDSLDWTYWVTKSDEDVTVSGEYASHSVSINHSLWKNEYNDLLNAACSWLRANERGATSLFALGSAGVSVEHKYLTSVLRKIAQSTPTDGEELAEYILAVSFSGISAVNVSERDLIAELADFPDISRPHAALALRAADCNAYELAEGSTNDRSALLNVILAAQNEDGSFSPRRGETGTVLNTALSLTALAPYSGDQAVLQAVDRGVAYLAEHHDPVSGGYLTVNGTPDCRTTATVIIALSSLGIRPDEERFAGEEGDMMQMLLSMQLEGGGFVAFPGGAPGADVTETAILAMVAQKSGRSPYLLRSPIVGEGSPLLDLPEPEPESSEVIVEEPEPEPISRLSIIFGVVGLAIGILLGAIALFAARYQLRPQPKW